MQQSNLLNNLLNLKSPAVSANKVVSKPQPTREPSSDQQDFQAVMAQTRAETVKPKPAAKVRQSPPAEAAHGKNRQTLNDNRGVHKARPDHSIEKAHSKKQDAAMPEGRPVIAVDDPQQTVSSAQADTKTEGQVPTMTELQPVTGDVAGILLVDTNANPVIQVEELDELTLAIEESGLPLQESENFDAIVSEAETEIAIEEISPLVEAVASISPLMPAVETEGALVAPPLTDVPLSAEDGIAPLLSSGDTKPSVPLSSIPASPMATSTLRSQIPVPEMAVSILGDEPVLVDGALTQTDTETQDAETTPSTMAGNIQALKQALQKPLDNLLPTQEKVVVADTAKPATPTVTSLVDALGRPQEQPLAATRSFMAQIQLPQTLGQPQWNQAVGERVLWMAAQNLTVADIRLDPPDLGTMHVKVTVQQDQASVTFVSQHQVVREALDQQATRLREMFAEQGLNLVNVDVSDRHAHERKTADDEQSGGHKAKQGEEEELQVIGQIHPLNLRLIDHYA